MKIAIVPRIDESLSFCRIYSTRSSHVRIISRLCSVKLIVYVSAISGGCHRYKLLYLLPLISASLIKYFPTSNSISHDYWDTKCALKKKVYLLNRIVFARFANDVAKIAGLEVHR